MCYRGEINLKKSKASPKRVSKMRSESDMNNEVGMNFVLGREVAKLAYKVR